MNTGNLTAELVALRRRLPLAISLAVSETKARYRRSVLGPWWLTLGAGIGVLGLGIVWSALLNQAPSELMPRLAIGLVLWQFISGSLVEASSVFIRQAQIIRNYNLPLIMHPLQLVMRQLITLAHNIAIVLLMIVCFPHAFSFYGLVGILGLIIVTANLLFIVIIIGVAGTRFRDLDPLVQSLMPLLFFVTPVIYEPKNLGISQFVIWLNPFTYFMEIVRAPFFGKIPCLWVYGVSFVSMVVCGIVAISLLSGRGRRLAFWL
ncbi:MULTISPECIES: ABC transporter permease [unclassified Mesorhizobium]|uniref:ABC transporter permease n=1 Tax=unclassified Mesorhizobium TaxID=325217 RepID=UPI0009DCB20D|nr:MULTISPECIES: ABC transporter permease [unclassified Mesorhizobium]